MGERVGHRLDPRRIDRLGHVGMEHAGDAAHRPVSPGRRRGRRAGRPAPARARKSSIAGRALTPAARARRGDQHRDRALRAAEQARPHRLQLHPHAASGQDPSDAVEADDLAHQSRARRSAPPVRRAEPRRRRSRPSALRRDRALAEADQLVALGLAGDRRRWQGRPRGRARRDSGRCGHWSAPAKCGRQARPLLPATRCQPGTSGSANLGGRARAPGGREIAADQASGSDGQARVRRRRRAKQADRACGAG